TDGQLASASINVTVPATPPAPDVPPNAVDSGSCVELGCTFDGTASNDPDGSVTAYHWDFGDGTTSTAPAPTHAYATAGAYTYGLTVTDDRGVSSTASTGSVTATAPPA